MCKHSILKETYIKPLSRNLIYSNFSDIKNTKIVYICFVLFDIIISKHSLNNNHQYTLVLHLMYSVQLFKEKAGGYYRGVKRISI